MKEIRNIFEFSVIRGDGHQVSRKQFWDKLYVDRKSIKTKLQDFYDSDPNFLVLSGYVGTGKSTIIRAIFEHYRISEGIIIDFSVYASRFQNDDYAEIQKNIYKILKTNLLNRIIEGISYYNVLENTTGIKQTIKEYQYDLECKVNDKLKKEISSRRQRNETSRILVIHALDTLDNPKIIRILNGIPGTDDCSFDEFYNNCQDYFKEQKNRNVVEDVLDILEWSDLIDLHRKIFNIPETRPYTIAFDNIDEIQLKNIQNHFFENLFGIMNYKDPNIRPGGLSVLPRINVILGVRDENISRIVKNGEGSYNALHYRLHKNDYRVSLENRESTLLEPNRQKYLYDVIDLRLKEIESLLGSSDFVSAVSLFWLNPEKNSFRSEDGYLNLRQLSNDSIRFTLNLINEITHDVLKYLKDYNLSHKDKFPFSLLKGKVIRFMTKFESTNNVLHQFKDCILIETENAYCCSLRLVLVYLSNIRPTPSTLFSDMKNSFQSIYNIDEFLLRQSVKNLYFNEIREAELVSIYQHKLISSSDDIQDESIIRLNDRGLTFLEKITINIDFYGFVVNEDKDTDPFASKVLVERMPEEAYDYCRKIKDLTRSLLEQNRKFYRDVISVSICATQDKVSSPWEFYRRNYTHGNEFHLDRVFASHINAILNYIFQVSRGENAFILTNPKKTKQLIVYKSNTPLKKASIFEIVEYLKSMEFKSHHPLVKLMEIVDDYIAMRSELKKLKEFVPTLDKINIRKDEIENSINNNIVHVKGHNNTVISGVNQSTIGLYPENQNINLKELGEKKIKLEEAISKELIALANQQEKTIIEEILVAFKLLPSSTEKEDILKILELSLLENFQKVQLITPILLRLLKQSEHQANQPKTWDELFQMLNKKDN